MVRKAISSHLAKASCCTCFWSSERLAKICWLWGPWRLIKDIWSVTSSRVNFVNLWANNDLIYCKGKSVLNNFWYYRSQNKTLIKSEHGSGTLKGDLVSRTHFGEDIISDFYACRPAFQKLEIGEIYGWLICQFHLGILKNAVSYQELLESTASLS